MIDWLFEFQTNFLLYNLTVLNFQFHDFKACHLKRHINKAQRPTMRPQAFLGISSYRDERDARRKSEYGNSHLWWQICQRATLMLFMTLYAFRIISVHKTLNFMHFLQKRDIRTDGPTDGHTLLQRCEDASKKECLVQDSIPMNKN